MRTKRSCNLPKNLTARLRLAWLACAAAAIGIASAQPSEIVLYAFETAPGGMNPTASVIRDPAGNFFGTAGAGGAGQGVVYQVDSTGKETVLHSFTGGADGGYPYAGVIRDQAGNLYGTTVQGGSNGVGVLYRIDKTGAETVLYNFTGGADGGNPYGGVIRDAAGNLYGTTYHGGLAGCGGGCGIVYKLDTANQEHVLYSFTGGADGANPSGGLISDSAGHLYGTATFGGSTASQCAPINQTSGCGVIFELDRAGNEKTLYTFTGATLDSNDGANPYAGLTSDSAGNLYGTTVSGGLATQYPGPCSGTIDYRPGCGTVFKLDTAGTMHILVTFDIAGPYGASPYAGVTLDSAGNLYGTTENSGLCCGVVFKLDTGGTLSLVHSFTGGPGRSGPDGGYPYAAVILDSAGNLYGTTQYGGSGCNSLCGAGVIYKLDTSNTETILYNFTNSAPVGTDPASGVIRDSAGNLYGTTAGGSSGCGAIFRLEPAGPVKAPYTFSCGPDGAYPSSGLVADSAGNLYGTTGGGGTSGNGVVFKLDTTGHETPLYSFSGGAGGVFPSWGLVLDGSGNLYGTADGGNNQVGVVYMVDSAGLETVLYTFTTDTGGSYPSSGVIFDAAGNLYGTTTDGGNYNLGVVYKLDSSGNETVLHHFRGGKNDGSNPAGNLLRDAAGNIYGTTTGGGTNAGVVYKLNFEGHLKMVYSFTGGADGLYPSNGVIADAAGNLYGTTTYGGITVGTCQSTGILPAGCGVVFKVDPSGNETVLHAFTGGADGKYPLGPLTIDSSGNLYGTASAGGTTSGGVVFELPGVAVPLWLWPSL